MLAVNGPRMTVRYTDGSEAELNVNIQARIWENIVAEQEAKAASSRHMRQSNKDTTHYIKAVSLCRPARNRLPGWQGARRHGLPNAGTGPENQARRPLHIMPSRPTPFSPSSPLPAMFEANPKQHTYTTELAKAAFFATDVDATVPDLEHGVSIDSIDLRLIPISASSTSRKRVFLSHQRGRLRAAGRSPNRNHGG